MQSISEYTQTAPEMTGVLVLGALGAVFQKKYSVLSINKNTEQLSIYAVAISPPAKRKSEVIRFIIAPFLNYQNYYNHENKKELSASEATRKSLKAALNWAESKIDGTKSSMVQEVMHRVFPIFIKLFFRRLEICKGFVMGRFLIWRCSAMLDRHIVQELFDPDYIEFLRKLVTLNVLRNPALGITKMILAGNSRGTSQKQARVFRYFVYNKYKPYCVECKKRIARKDMADAVCCGGLCWDCF